MLRLNPRTQVPTPYLEDTPAPVGAGEPKISRRRENKVHVEAAVLIVKLEVNLKMYRELIKKGVGTNIVESEIIEMVHECVAGPTGHKLVMEQRRCDSQQTVELDPEMKGEGSGEQCWRDPSLVKRLLSLRRRMVANQLRKARIALADKMKFLMSVNSSEESKVLWAEVRAAKLSTWGEVHPKHQQKIAHLVRRAENCSKHLACRKIDRVWNARESARIVSVGARKMNKIVVRNTASKVKKPWVLQPRLMMKVQLVTTST